MLRFGFILVAILVCRQPAQACSVPLFRFALEQWTPSPYDLYVFYRGPLDEDALWKIEELRLRAKSANVTVTPVNDADELDPDLQAIRDLDSSKTDSPRVVLRFPKSGPKIAHVWSGSLDEAARTRLFDSPGRQAIFDRLTFGNAGVVVLLLSGNAELDDRARKLLTKELPRITSEIELPAPTDDGPQIQSLVPLKVAFPLIEIERTPTEDTLVRILVGSEDGLANVRGPIAFPVFGRGRALCSLHGNSLFVTDEMQRSLDFLCRACSCQVQDLNPGLDLLMTGNWSSAIAAEPGPKPREVTPRAETRSRTVGGPGRAEQRSPPPPGYAAIEVEHGLATSPRVHWLRVGTIVAVVLFLASGVWVLRSRRTIPPEQP